MFLFDLISKAICIHDENKQNATMLPGNMVSYGGQHFIMCGGKWGLGVWGGYRN